VAVEEGSGGYDADGVDGTVRRHIFHKECNLAG
jgi:hypothetical protein